MRRCNHCPRRTISSDNVAWSSGWRWFNGTTQDGRDFADVACPVCAGVKEPVTQSWDVECSTCGWNFLTDDYLPGDEPLTTAKDAVYVGHGHRCEPSVRVIDPDRNGTDLYNFDRNGNLRKKG